MFMHRLVPRLLSSHFYNQVKFLVNYSNNLRRAGSNKYLICTNSNNSLFHHDGQINIIGTSNDDLIKEFEHFKIEKYRVQQVQSWIYNKGVFSFEHMTDIPKNVRKILQEKYFIDTGTIVDDKLAKDGTRKWVISFGGHEVEMVFIPESTRGTLCVSSQVGCSLSCAFCHTGTQPLVRNLSTAEILSQVLMAKKMLYDFPSSQSKVISNVVFMGQGEPFYNYRNVSAALRLILDNRGLSFSKRKITVSTSGIAPIIPRFGKDFFGMNLAISLHAVTDDLRSQLVPANRQWPLSALFQALREFPGSRSGHKKLAFEYVMLKNVNDSMEDAKRLAQIVKEFKAIVNLIPFNPWPGAPFECSSYERIVQFAKTIESYGVPAPIRWPRGDDILAACGQLKTLSLKQRTSTSQQNSNSSNNQSQYNNNNNNEQKIRQTEGKAMKTIQNISQSAMSI